LEAFSSKTSFSPLLVIGHMVNDTSSNLLSGLLPVLTMFFGLSYLLAGLVATVFNLTSSILQPLFGRWFDRTQTTWLLEAGLALNCFGMSLVGISPTYVVLLFLVGTAGLGSAAFHPPAFSTVVRSSASEKGGAMGIFLSGGNTGFFLGPIVAGALVSGFGLSGTLVLLPLGLLTAALLLRVRKLGGGHEEPSTEILHQPPNKRLVGLLATITALRSMTIQTAVTFLPLYFVVRGESLFLATAIASIWLGVGVMGQLGGGFISDRVGRRPVIVTSLLTGGLLFYGFLITHGTMSLILLALSGAALYANWSVIVVMSSEAAPSNIGAVSGLMLGFSIGIGGIAALVFGGVADLMGLHSAFLAFAGFALAGGLLALFLPRRALGTIRN
jgi:FSR family fosmidomycin resistance protein-like MFS transporter